MMKAAIPMTGGVIWPPVEAQASIAAARWGRNPARFISGIVTVPTVITFETMLPEIDPKRDDPTIAILAGPPRYLPISAIATSVKKVEPPALSSTWPKKTYTTTTVAMILIAMPRIALESQTR